MNQPPDLAAFFQDNISGFLVTSSGWITCANKRMGEWLNCEPAALTGKKFSDLLAIGGKIYYETHLAPLLKMQGYFTEVLLELDLEDRKKMRVLVNAKQAPGNDDTTLVYYTIMEATDRLTFEKNLQEAKNTAETALTTERGTVKLREQLIAVLGHDLRNPLNAISMGAHLLQESPLSENDQGVVTLISRSAQRMSELISNIMDFARSRLGTGMKIQMEALPLGPILRQVIDELRIAYPSQEITTFFNIDEPVKCDPYRLGQLLSNLVANALTHGSKQEPVIVKAAHLDGQLEISVINKGPAISPDLQRELFEPFTRDEDHASQNGLGLGLYISAEIATAHKGTLTCSSDAEATCFTFKMSDQA